MLFFAVCMVFGRSYDLTDSAEIVLGDKARVICAWIGGAGWMLLAIVPSIWLLSFWIG